jgi:hypothetical protein
LLEVGDIVHGNYYQNIKDKNYIGAKSGVRPFEITIKDSSDIHQIKHQIYNCDGKITAIELHENRVIQEVKEWVN